MNSSDTRGQFYSQGCNLSQIIIVYALHHSRDQRHSHAEIRTDPDRFQLCLKKRLSPKSLIDLLARSVELEKDDVQSGIRQSLCVIRLLSQSDPVGIHLGIAAAGFFGKADQLRQIIPQRGLAA